MLPGGEHALQRAAQHTRTSPSSTSATLQGRERRRHGGAARRRRALAARSPACPIIEGYGLSETSPTLTCNRADINEFTGTIGLPVPSTEISIRDDDGNEVPLGPAGRDLRARPAGDGAATGSGPKRPRKVMTADGFFTHRRHRRAWTSSGYVKIVDRKKDMVLVSGFNVYPNEVEDVVAMHPGVLECAVIGVPDEASGEAVKLFVVQDATRR